MNDLRGKIDQARRDMANATWCASNDNASIDVVLVWAQTIAALYAQLDPVRQAPQPVGLKLAGRCKDGSYIFTKSGSVSAYKTVKGATVKRRVTRRVFPVSYYRRDSEFPNVEVVPVCRANVSNDLIFAGVQA